MTERKLCTVRRIAEVKEIPGKDRIVSYRVDGWWVTDQKDKYCIGELVVYAEPDSWMPHTLAPFLTKAGAYPKVFNEVEGQKLKTIKMGGVYSQGLLLPLQVAADLFIGSKFDEGQEYGEFFFEGNDLTELLGIQLWEKPEDLRAANAKGNFPHFLRKTDCTRIQNYGREVRQYAQESEFLQATEKLDGSSMTVFKKDGVVGVCSRNLELKDEPGVTFWEVAKSEGLLAFLEDDDNIALQGELVGPGIQGNSYGLQAHAFYLYDIFDIEKQEYLDASTVEDVASGAGIKHVPVLGYYRLPVLFERQPSALIPAAMLAHAEGDSLVGVKPKREGVVWKPHDDTNVAVKCISQAWLAKHDSKEG